MKRRRFSGSNSSTGNISLLGYTLVFMSLLVHKLDSAHFSVIGPDQPLVATVGDEVVLACRLSPRMSAQNMEVRWYRGQFSSVVHLYREGKDQYVEQMSEYRQRTEFQAGDIADGSVALRIRDIRLSDAGLYMCFFRSEVSYQEAAMELRVAVSGTSPLISIEAYQDGGVRLVCRSGGWYPEPQSLWKGLQGQPLPSLPAKCIQDENSLFQTESVLIVTEKSNQNLTCAVRNSVLNQEGVSRVYLADAFFPKISYVTVIRLTLNLLVLAFFIPCAIYYLWKQSKDTDKLRSQLKSFEENQRFQVEKEKEHYLASFLLRKARRFSVNVTLDPTTAHPELWVSPDQKSVRYAGAAKEQPIDPDLVDSYRCVLGAQKFASGRHYWEVKLKKKTVWHLGVCADTDDREQYKSIEPENGYWAIRLWNREYKALSTPRTTITLEIKPERVGVFLDYEGEEVSFFSLPNGSHIYTFNRCVFGRRSLRPFFSPGIHGSKEDVPLIIFTIRDW
ncbi:butyrophilin subfamily 1 member A1-like [Pelodiscus sinensis]|uniref:butyrophilin subfamily 1 member A1-like n=1 Tax=Pelodiscus sinensis TaxID=13735 RepID=UPI003F6D5C0E